MAGKVDSLAEKARSFFGQFSLQKQHGAEVVVVECALARRRAGRYAGRGLRGLFFPDKSTTERIRQSIERIHTTTARRAGRSGSWGHLRTAPEIHGAQLRATVAGSGERGGFVAGGGGREAVSGFRCRGGGVFPGALPAGDHAGAHGAECAAHSLLELVSDPGPGRGGPVPRGEGDAGGGEVLFLQQRRGGK